MSQLVDIKRVVRETPHLNEKERGELFYSILDAVGWELDGVESAEDAQVYLELNPG